MATDNMMGGLFGTPEQYQQQRMAQQEAQAIQQAKLSNYERGLANQQMGFNRLADVGAGLLGVEDPQMQAMSAMQDLSRKYDTSSSGGMAGFATELQNRGFTQQAYKAGQAALAMREKEATIQAKTMEKLTNEQKNAAGLADSAGLQRGTPEWTNTYNTELSRLTAGSKGANIKEIGVAEGTRQPVYFDVATDTQFVVRQDPKDPTKQVRVAFNGGVDRTTARTSVDARNMGESAFVKELGTLDAKKVSEAMTTRGAAIDQLKTLQKMAEVQQRPVISGTLAEQRTDVSNFFNTVGLSSSADRIKTADSQEYIKYSTGLVLDNLKKTGYNPSNADMKVVQSIIPRLETDPRARTELIKFMSEKANEVVTESNNLETFARANKGLSGYKPTIPQVSFGGTTPTTTSVYSGLSDAELNARIAAAKARK
jgi:hypothetical protein